MLSLFQHEAVTYGKINVMVALVLRPEVFLNQIDVKQLILLNKKVKKKSEIISYSSLFTDKHLCGAAGML